MQLEGCVIFFKPCENPSEELRNYELVKVNMEFHSLAETVVATQFSSFRNHEKLFHLLARTCFS